MRRFMVLLSLLLLVVGCSSGSVSGDIDFVHSRDTIAGTSDWTATGEAIDNDLFCSVATGELKGFEDENGATRTPEDIEALFESGEPFVNVSVESMHCGDAYADFELRFINHIDPTASSGGIGTTWTITGGVGYETTSGEGPSFFYDGTGTITRN